MSEREGGLERRETETIAELGALDSLNEQLHLNRVCISGVLIILRILRTIRSKCGGGKVETHDERPGKREARSAKCEVRSEK